MMDVEAQPQVAPPAVPPAVPRPEKRDFCVMFDAASAFLITSIEVITHVLQEATFSFTASDEARSF